jgi:hypothetical protein
VPVCFHTLHGCTLSSCVNRDPFLFVMNIHVSCQTNQDLKRVYGVHGYTVILFTDATHSALPDMSETIAFETVMSHRLV